MTVTSETPLKEIIPFVDFRDYFLNKEEDFRQDRNDNIHIECPSCGARDKCYVYAANIFCHKCRSRWGMYDWLTNIEGLDRETAVLELQSLAHAEQVHAPRGQKNNHYEINDEEIEKLNNFVLSDHENLTKEKKQWWYDRGVSEEAINTFSLGEHDGWYTIPLRDDYGTTFGIKKRWKGTKEDSPHKTRYECTKGSKVQYAPLIFRNKSDDVAIIVGGEIKGLVLWSYLREKGIPWTVIAVATGENPWQAHWNEYMKFNKIAIWPDKDQAGYDFAHAIHTNFRGDLPMIFPDDSDAKAVDDYILEGNDAIREIKTALNI